MAGLEKAVYHDDLWGSRIEKYKSLAENEVPTKLKNKLIPSAPDWFFKPFNKSGADVYRKNWSIKDIYSPQGDPAPGFVTTHDQFAISYSPEEATKKVEDLIRSHNEEVARKLFRLCKQDQWNYQIAKEELAKLNISQHTRKILYRPFDERWTVWDNNVTVHRRERVMNEISSNNLGLVTSRLTKGESFAHAQITELPVEAICMSPTTSNNGFLFPLNSANRENLNPSFRAYIDARFDHHYTAEEILGYIYAILHATTYRIRNAEFLRIEFPRIPFPETNELFEKLSTLGWSLVQAHLLRDLPRTPLAEYCGRGDHTVKHIRWSAEDEMISINKTQGFRPVPEAVWNFHIGGYQVIDKYLKSRKGRVLSLDEITHVGRIADALSFTIAQMEKIDTAYLIAFPEQAATSGGQTAPAPRKAKAKKA